MSTLCEFVCKAIYRRAARQENQQVASGSGDIALDMENLPCANGRSETLKPNLAVGILSR
ncbi:MAG: hypothetical protein MSR29_04775 [Lachnospiraceae bacterium]|nr:hypothetical protein [Lachnospiraceae bacterium]